MSVKRIDKEGQQEGYRETHRPLTLGSQTLSLSFQELPSRHGQRFGLLLGMIQNPVWLY